MVFTLAGFGGGALYVSIGGDYGSASNTSVALTGCYMSNNTVGAL